MYKLPTLFLLIFSAFIAIGDIEEFQLENNNLSFEDIDLNAGNYITEDFLKLTIELQTTLSGINNISVNNSINLNSTTNQQDNSNNERKNPSFNNGYYTINGNKDIVILGNQKQALYTYASKDWNLAASFTLNVYNVGYLTYGDITLCDIDALESGEDYSEFIYNVNINGFSSNYEYRLELHNGQVTIWSKLPGDTAEIIIPDKPSENLPEPKSPLLTLISSLLLLFRKRK